MPRNIAPLHRTAAAVERQHQARRWYRERTARGRLKKLAHWLTMRESEFETSRQSDTSWDGSTARKLVKHWHATLNIKGRGQGGCLGVGSLRGGRAPFDFGCGAKFG